MKDKKPMRETGIQEVLEYTEKIINAIYDPIIILDENLKVALANSSFYQTFHVVPAETEEQFIYNLGNGQWNVSELRELLEDILPKTTSFRDFKIERDFPHIGRRVMLLNACRIYIETNRTKLIIITIKDISDLKV